ncbi:MAG: hypothetical protein JO249_15445, partial [Acidobacteria bacterium]|nr:hypothetical protein [Acidobacteriota bacterium]
MKTKTAPYAATKLSDYTPGALDDAVATLLCAVDSEAAALEDESEWKAFRDRWMARKNGILTQINDLWLKPAP